jgi:hypothetical protein
MKPIFLLAALMALNNRAWASCTIESLTLEANKSLFGKVSKTIEQDISRSAEGGSFFLYFDGDVSDPFDEKAPHEDPGTNIYAMRAENSGHVGSGVSRITFLNQRDFIIREISLQYEGPNYGYNGGQLASAQTVDYFFCNGKQILPRKIPSGLTSKEYSEQAVEAQKLFFEAPELTQYIERVIK